jgi:hypothetical protein
LHFCQTRAEGRVRVLVVVVPPDPVRSFHVAMLGRRLRWRAMRIMMNVDQ